MSSVCRRLSDLFITSPPTESIQSSTTFNRLSNIFRSSLPTAPTTTTTPLLKSLPTAPTQITKTFNPLSNNERKLNKLVKNLKKSSESGRFRSRHHDVYVSTIHRLLRANKFSVIEDILEDQKKYLNVSTEAFGNLLIFLYGKSGMLNHAQKLFDEMPIRTVNSFNALLEACVNSKNFDKLDEIFKELPAKLSFHPDVVSYNTIIKAFCEKGSVVSALTVLDQMEKSGVDPDVITFNTLLHACYQNNKFFDGDEIWALMEKNNVVPNVRSYNSKLRALVLNGRTEEALDMFEELKSKMLKPDVFSLNSLIIGFCNDGNLEEAKKWYSELLKNKCAPDRVTFNTLVPFLCKKEDFSMAFELCQEFIKRRIIVDTKLVQMVVDGLLKESKIEEAKELVKLGRSNNYFRYKLKLSSEM